MKVRVIRLTALLAAIICFAETAQGQTSADLDAAWSSRSDGHVGGKAAPEPIAAIIADLEAAVADDDKDLSLRTALLRALYFQGEFAAPGKDEKLKVFTRGREVAEAGIAQVLQPLTQQNAKPSQAQIAAALAENRDGVAQYFWGAVHWGLWGRYRGKIAAAREGAAGRIRDYAEIVIAADPGLEGAGGHRVLGRLHAEAPKLPFITGWIDRERAIRELERAVQMAPDSPLNALYLVEALLEYDHTRKDEARTRLRRLTATEPRPEYPVEDSWALEQARALLAREEG